MAANSPVPTRTTPISAPAVSNWYIAAIGLAQFGIYVAILSPVFVSMQLKAQELNPANPASVIAVVLPIGSIFGNPLFGSLSDRTRTRWGRRRPWLLGGVVTLLIGLTAVVFSPNVLMLTFAWLLCQLGSNAAFAALMASFADNVPVFQRGRASSVIGVAQNISILAGIYAAALLVANLTLLFLIPGVVGVACVVVYVLVTPDRVPDTPLRPFSVLAILRTFWTNPVKYPDFGLAWGSRFLIVLATFLFTTFRLFYMQDHLGLDARRAVSAVATGVLLYTVAIFVSTAVSGWLSDKLRRRKIFVGGSTLLFGAGLVALVYAESVPAFYVAEIIMGFAYGTYTAVDYALVVDVLPDPEKPGKDLGVMNIANSLPQSFAPALGALLLSMGSGKNYPVLLWTAGIIAAIGAAVIIPIRKVR
ncbi:major facilitator transporter [Amycolatopsis mediterranei S699]|uniref:MFS transporter n=1 Tax=Amycolatopsis mediterranei TaxID=33910 RepID=UPI000274B7D7|nr:MFS transporter [Amycolatopsis mediterranei]AFO80679.1 major facilitator transporter [Amycolatopsis mediterranei S699]